nr:MAG TPA: helix-turn-helix domain protein [Caudoviricetes sp.]
MRRPRGSRWARRRAVERMGPCSRLMVCRAAASTSSAGMPSAAARLAMVSTPGSCRIWSAAICPILLLERWLASARSRYERPDVRMSCPRVGVGSVMRSMVPHWTLSVQPICVGRSRFRYACTVDSSRRTALRLGSSSGALDTPQPRKDPLPMNLKEWPAGVSRADLMTVSEAAAELGYRDGRQIRAAIRDGRLDGYRPMLGRAALVARADVDRLKAPVAA